MWQRKLILKDVSVVCYIFVTNVDLTSLASIYWTARLWRTFIQLLTSVLTSNRIDLLSWTFQSKALQWIHIGTQVMYDTTGSIRYHALQSRRPALLRVHSISTGSLGVESNRLFKYYRGRWPLTRWQSTAARLTCGWLVREAVPCAQWILYEDSLAAG